MTTQVLVMARDKRGNGTTSLADVISEYRGVYNRIALQCGVDPSYVSRIACGDRNNREIKGALAREMNRLHKLATRWLGTNGG